MSGLGKRGLGERLSRLTQWPHGFVAGLIVAALSIAAYVLVGYAGKPSYDTEREGERLSAIMKAHDERMSVGLNEIVSALRDSCLEDTLQALESVAHSLSETDEYCYYVFRGDELRYWHNAMLPDMNIPRWAIRTPIMWAENGIYYVRRAFDGGCSVCIMLRVWSTFPYNNDYLTDGFTPSLGLPPTSHLSKVSTAGCVDVFGDGGYLFSVENPWPSSLPDWAMSLSIFLLVTFATSMFWAAGRIVKMLLLRGWDAIVALGVSAVFYVVVYVVMLKIAPPWGGEGLLMFSPMNFAYDWWLPSYWILAVITSCVLHLSYILFRIADVSHFKLASRGKAGAYVLTGVLTLACAATYLGANGDIEVIVRHSRGLSFYAGEIDMSVTSLVKVSIIGAAVMAFLFTAERAVAVITQVVNPVAGIVALCVGTIVTSIVGATIFDASGFSMGLGFAVLSLTMSYMESRSGRMVRFSHFVWLMVMTAGFTLVRMTHLNAQKEHEYRQTIATNLSIQMSMDNDPIAEQLLPQIDKIISSDSTLIALMGAKELSYDDIFTHIRNRYFNAYFSRYDLQVIPCRGPKSTLQMTDGSREEDCVPFFTDLAGKKGRAVPRTSNFYCLNNGDSRPCYLAKLDFDDCAPAGATPNRLYLQITLKNTPRAAGYPELLTNKRDMQNYRMPKGYSYAKYDKSRLTSHHGEFDYPATVKLSADGTAIIPDGDDASHYVLRTRNQQTIVVTYPKQSLSNILTCFSYLFLGLLIVASLIMAVASVSRLTFFGHMNIRERIHASLVFFIIAFFAIMCVISGYQAVASYESVSKRHMSQVMSSFYVSFSDELRDITASDLQPGPQTAVMVDYVLQTTSNTTGGDAHIFDVDGRLIGSSRRELFLSGIAAPLMNSEALLALREGGQSETYIKEHIGSMIQNAAYMPLYNGKGDVLGYLNVPMFNDANAMRSQVIASIEPMTNSLVFIVILSIIASAALARGITRPLLELRDMLKRVDLQSADVRLTYPYDDEVGQVVSAYNKMNDKLHSQAERLAATERESTWREMARQIAHEIKNPLTPMKLSIQYLLKCWDVRRENFEPMLKKTAQTLVDQIDQLSAVASQFSGIAKMKQAEPVVYDLAARLSATAMMFGRTDESDITFSGPQEGVMIKADPDLMTSVFNNLIKNAQQSAADGRKVDIGVALSTNGESATVTVSDNGDGIPDEIREKIFRANFTTKSTGMGLGLAITKNIVVNSGGEITFETQVGRGTTFTVTLPLTDEQAQK